MPGVMIPAINARALLEELLLPTNSFKRKKCFDERLEQTKDMMRKYPDKIPVIVEKYIKEKELPDLERCRFLVPFDATMSQLVMIIRARMSVAATQAFFIIINRKNLAQMSMSLLECYNDMRDEDGYLYLTYCSQEAFGGEGDASGLTSDSLQESFNNLSI
jgi:microtubule-associated protein 1 light chain